MSSTQENPIHEAVSIPSLEYWQALRYFNFYRLVVAISLLSVSFSSAILIKDSFSLLLTARAFIFLYFIVGVYFIINTKAGKQITSLQITLGLVSDFVLLLVFQHSIGGLESGVGILLLVALAASAILTTNRQTLSYAAAVSIYLLLEYTYSSSYGFSAPNQLFQIGIYGVINFGTAILVRWLVIKLHENQALAEQRGADLDSQVQLNEFIIQRMRTGILVVDPEHKVRLMNESAWYLLGMPSPLIKTLAELSSILLDRLESWKSTGIYKKHAFSLCSDMPPVVVRFADLHANRHSGTLIFIEDPSLVSRRAEEMTLASLGRLAASIAHEIRNPLSAISHAAQLLTEAEHLKHEDKRLTEIISNHCNRMNDIVESVLDLSRRERSKPELIQLSTWLPLFISNFKDAVSSDQQYLSGTVVPDDLVILFDPTHLDQIITNICANSAKYGRDGEGRVAIELRCQQTDAHIGPIIEVQDTGAGIPEEIAQQIFEPFFSTGVQTSGLGLYICKQLCEANQTTLDYVPQVQGACFRLSFPPPRLGIIAER